ncbi:ABC transporter ATP-binding protein [Rhizobium sp. EC-SD404]|uniref:ABC transporter ATP-binding protein n=1 Tax=Rhizobium sp. EC-SD404 TaxID=2038389 RepID=UPI001259B02E|nr:ABC transporter ATP-binding protein [Rhizobium sp. EC-SD404]VVT22961.1 Phospholipid/cholesterol/gamma-HCH transport system ATP-binding protein [Rhizobium sp. EC-SD404]
MSDQTDMKATGASGADRNTVLSVRGVNVSFGSNTVLQDLDLDIYRGEILGFIGPSGTGKSVLMRAVLRLLPRQSGKIWILGHDYETVSDAERMALDMRLGVLFQQGALFSSLTVRENIQVPMREYLDLPQSLMDELTMLKIEMVGLAPQAADRYPSELSGGMIKRAALARALALDPDLVFLDEPTSGLDPIGAAEFDELIARLRDTLGLTVYMVTHDLDSLFSVCDRIAVLGDKKVKAQGTIEEMLAFDDEWIQSYFHGKRARSIVRDDGQPNRAGAEAGTMNG